MIPDKHIIPPIYKSLQNLGTDRVQSLVKVMIDCCPYRLIEYFHNNELPSHFRESKGPSSMVVYIDALNKPIASWIKKAQKISPILDHLHQIRNAPGTYGTQRPGTLTRSSGPVVQPTAGVLTRSSPRPFVRNSRQVAFMQEEDEVQYLEEDQFVEQDVIYEDVNMVEAPHKPLVVSKHSGPSRPVYDPATVPCDSMVVRGICSKNNCPFSHAPAVIDKQRVASYQLRTPPIGGPVVANGQRTRQLAAISNGEDAPKSTAPVMHMREVLDNEDSLGSDSYSGQF
jgi:hypothetical protein